MKTEQIRFDDGASYERYMGKWSQLAGEAFLDWIAPARGQRWLDVGCGNGAFTEMLIGHSAPVAVEGVDPSAQQLIYARTRPALGNVKFIEGDAMALPYGEDSFDIAVMPLVIFFVPEPAKGVAEMARVVRPGGVVAAYAWDMYGGGFPYDALLSEIRGLGIAVPKPPSPEASRIDDMRNLWAEAGLDDIETRAIEVSRTFADFDDFWETARGAPSVGATLARLTGEDLESLKARVRERLPADAEGRITYSARANAVKGRVRQY
ncbi:class I SAM-dependent methyltransferase [Pseudomonas vanderleydeniana]|uniref:Methyltransferase domain-containing protein n=1 Tax=Pseudomonas vanderleydeniana TaxID=2745495 RepID=A0A9E6PR87_9PSED|nr:class I SAM-dependent methyltransferase [Pseudomonas vanderleydeniana]QXI31295.1 methyltransferase domain-containing protein [Pseudomonas vanderleydeniana]